MNRANRRDQVLRGTALQNIAFGAGFQHSNGRFNCRYGGKNNDFCRQPFFDDLGNRIKNISRHGQINHDNVGIFAAGDHHNIVGTMSNTNSVEIRVRLEQMFDTGKQNWMVVYKCN